MGIRMIINIMDTNQLYKEMLTLPDQERASFFDKMVMQPFAPMYESMNMPRDPSTLGCLALSGTDKVIEEMLANLGDSDAWKKAYQAIEVSEKSLHKSNIKIPEELLLGILLADPMIFAESQGYSGIGSCPGYIKIMVAPNEYNLKRMSSCVAHEFHHNVLFYNAKWNFMNVTLSQYLAVEGLAESFAASLYGEELNGPWVANINETDLSKASSIIGRDIDVEGFMEVRKYMYGDHPMVPEGKALGIPYCAGYAVGYHAVQSYLNKTSKTVAEATKAFIDGVDIVKQSGYFFDVQCD
jgi:uncharacterized protein YjaZ